MKITPGMLQKYLVAKKYKNIAINNSGEEIEYMGWEKISKNNIIISSIQHMLPRLNYIIIRQFAR